MLPEKYIYILSLEMASPGNQHCASCIGTLSFPIAVFIAFVWDTFKDAFRNYHDKIMIL